MAEACDITLLSTSVTLKQNEASQTWKPTKIKVFDNVTRNNITAGNTKAKNAFAKASQSYPDLFTKPRIWRNAKKKFCLKTLADVRKTALTEGVAIVAPLMLFFQTLYRRVKIRISWNILALHP